MRHMIPRGSNECDLCLASSQLTVYRAARSMPPDGYYTLAIDGMPEVRSGRTRKSAFDVLALWRVVGSVKLRDNVLAYSVSAESKSPSVVFCLFSC